MLDGMRTVSKRISNLRALDSDTVVTWTRIIDAVLQMIDKEIEHMHNKAPDSKKARLAKTQEDVAGTLRAILKFADRALFLFILLCFRSEVALEGQLAIVALCMLNASAQRLPSADRSQASLICERHSPTC